MSEVSEELAGIIWSYHNILFGLPLVGLVMAIIGLSSDSFFLFLFGVIILAGSLSI